MERGCAARKARNLRSDGRPPRKRFYNDVPQATPRLDEYMFQDLAHRIRRYDFTLAAIKASLVLSLLFVAFVIFSGLLW